MKMYDADSLVAKLEAARNKLSMTGLIAAERNVTKFALQVVYDEPTIDAEHVRHGRWYRDPTDENYFCCSVCDGANGLWHHLADCTYEFCPWCGAKMDLKEDDHAAD